MAITAEVPNFSGGLCTTPTELVDCATLTDMVINRNGSIQGREGYTQNGGATSGIPIAIIKAYMSGGAKTVIQTSTTMQWLNGSTWTSVGTFAAGTGLLGSMCQFGLFCLAASPNYTGILRWNGTGSFAVISGSPTNIRTIVSDQNYVYAADQNNTIWYSDSGDSGTWPADHFLTVGGERDTIHDMAFMFNKLYIFRESGIWVKQGAVDSEFELMKLANDRCYSKVACGHDGVYMMSDTGVMKFDGSTCRRVSAKIDDSTFTPQSDGQFMHYQYGERKLFVPQPATTYVYDELMDRWMTWSIVGLQCAFETGPGQLDFACASVAKVFQGWSGTTDAGTAIAPVVATKNNLDFGAPEILKRPKYIYVDGTLTSTTMTLKSNYGATTEQTFTSPGRINYCTPAGTPQRNFQVSFSGPQGLLLRSLKIVAHPISL